MIHVKKNISLPNNSITWLIHKPTDVAKFCQDLIQCVLNE